MMFTKRTEPIVAGQDAKVDATIDLIQSPEDAEAFVQRTVNGSPVFMLAFPALSIDKLKAYTTKGTGKTKLSFNVHVPTLQANGNNGAVYGIAPGRNDIWFGVETIVPESTSQSVPA